MLLNNLDAEVAERPEDLVVYGGSGKAARSHEALKAIVKALLALGDDETLLVQSGKPVAVFRTTTSAPRVLIANSLLVPKWATWDEFRRLEAEGLTMFGQMTAGSWIYIGSQGILQGTYQTFAAAGAEALRHVVARRAHDPDRRARRHGRRAAARGDDGGRRVPLHRGRPDADRAAARDALPRRGDRVARRRARTGPRRGGATGVPLSVGLLGNAADLVPELARRGEHFDLVTDQTAAHDPLTGYVPQGLSVAEAAPLRAVRSGRVPPPRPRVDRGARRRTARVRPSRQLRFRLWQQPAR